MARYGNQKTPYYEDMLPEPDDPYGIAKVAGENTLKLLADQHEMNYNIAVPHNIVGPNQKYDDPFRNVASIMVNRMLQNKQPIIYGDGSQKRAFSCIDDCLLPLWNAAVAPAASKQIINLGGIEEYSINQACEILRSVLPNSGNVIHKESRHEVKNSIPTFQKSIDLLDFEHKTDLKEGLSKMWEWVKTQPVRERFVWPFYELDKGIYSFWKTK